MTPDTLKAITDLVHALAWPLVTLLGLWWFKPEVRGLLGRIRRGAGLEFDPPTSQSPEVAVVTPAEISPDLKLSESAAAAMVQIQGHPEYKKATTDQRRIQLLLHALAWISVITNFEQVESAIWASQIAILEHLNALGSDSRANIKARFYDIAAARFPQMLGHYPFDSYLAFLRANTLVETDDEIVRISQFARDYLAWRVQAQKLPKTMG